MKNTLGAICLAAALAATAVSTAMAADSPADLTDMAALRSAVQADKKALVASTLKLTDAEAKKFWPIYDSYQRKLDLNNRRVTLVLEGLIAHDKPITDAYAKNIVTELMLVEEANVKARRTMHNRVTKALPAKKAARYLQLENKIRAVEAYDIAAAIPLVQ
jgi:hypothetical protein